MADIVAVLRRRALRRERVFRNRGDPLEKFNDVELIERCHFDRLSIIYLHALLKDHISLITRRSFALSSMLQVLVTLHYLATGCFLTVIGDVHGITKATAIL